MNGEIAAAIASSVTVVATVVGFSWRLGNKVGKIESKVDSLDGKVVGFNNGVNKRIDEVRSDFDSRLSGHETGIRDLNKRVNDVIDRGR